MKYALCIVLFVGPVLVTSLDNGLARTPPMGWMSWQRFRCNTDCVNYPKDCISEYLIKSTIDAMVSTGARDVGYTYVAISDCWMASNRSADGMIQPDPKRFPSGMKALADYAHSKNLKLGLYLDAGDTTCNGYPGSHGHLTDDAKTIANWGVDMLKLDGCNADRNLLNAAYPQMRDHLNATGRHILYSCAWPIFVQKAGGQPDYRQVAENCNMYRTYEDIQDGWEDLKDKLKHYGDNLRDIYNYSGPGNWNDPDQLVVGDYGLSLNQQEMQMAVWCIMGAPLFVSADIRNMIPESQAILFNKMAIGINQDPLGILGMQVQVLGQVLIWKKPILPKGSFALALVYTNISGGPTKVKVKLQDLGFNTAAAYKFTNVFSGATIGTYLPWYEFDCQVNPNGVLFVHALALP